VTRPVLEGLHDRVLDQLLGKVEVPDQPQQRSDQPRGFIPEDRRDRVARAYSPDVSTQGRTSTGPPPGQPLAISMASSRSAASTTAKPPTTSLDSMKGPSVTTGLPPLKRTVVAVRTACSSSPLRSLPSCPSRPNHSPMRW